MEELHLIWITGLPLLGFALCFLCGKRIGDRLCMAIALTTVGISFVLSLLSFLGLADAPNQRMTQHLFTWIEVGTFQVPFTLVIDRLSALYLLIICGIGFLIHLYSVGYMHAERGNYRFFAYLNLFIFFMTLLVMGSSLLVLFIGWEGVGLCSYLLIGYDYHRDAAAKAAKKAFIFNRVGDFGLIVASLLLFWSLGTLELAEINTRAATLWGDAASAGHNAGHSGGGGVIVTICTLFLFLAATGKSAQLPLYVWLPDAMEGPTPVSALIHAATMVTAGLYLLARLHGLYALAPFTQLVVLSVATATAFFAASIAMVQTDIKKVLAYSTVSQLGYMFMAMGVGAYLAGIFHVMTHAFFKALLFLAAGSVIRAMHHEQDMRQMGGLLKRMPITGWTYIIGALAISGFPLITAGFFSKDEILWKVFSGSTLPALFWSTSLITAIMTAFYMFRSVGLTFFGQASKSAAQAHESPRSMTIPLVLLAVLSLIGGWVGIPAFMGEPLGVHHQLEHYFAGFFSANAQHEADHAAHSTELILTLITTALSMVAMYISYLLFARRSSLIGRLRAPLAPLQKLLQARYYVDEIYHVVFVRAGGWFAQYILWRFIDTYLIDGLVNAVGYSLRNLGGALRFSQSGLVNHYAVVMMLGAVLMIWYLVF